MEAALLGAARDCARHVRFLGFGHALFEQALEPYLGMIAKTVFLQSRRARRIRRSTADRRRALVTHFKDRSRFASPKAMAPMPVLGIPGWHPARPTRLLRRPRPLPVHPTPRRGLMKTNFTKSVLAAALFATALSAAAQEAEPPVAVITDGLPDHVRVRVEEKAQQGHTALRRYIYSTRHIHNLRIEMIVKPDDGTTTVAKVSRGAGEGRGA
jgi:hypothetical protein